MRPDYTAFCFIGGYHKKKVAILVDGGFYRKVAKHLWGEKNNAY